MDEELFWLPARELRRRFVARALSPLEFARATLERIARIDPQLNSFITIDPETVIEQARRAEIAALDPERCGPLFGVPVSIKDSIATAGLRTAWGSRLYEHVVPARDDVCVARLRAAGAIILGKTAVPEFQMLGRTASLLGPETRNPWDATRIAGGSSGGSAASVAGGLNALSLGGDDGGSVRLPAAICGLFGFLPSAGRVPRLIPPGGDGYVGWPYQNMGPLARDVGDGALLTALIAGFDSSDPFGRRDRLDLPLASIGALPERRAAWLSFPAGARNRAVLDHVRAFAEALGEIGLHLAEDLPPLDLPHDPAIMFGYIGRFLQAIARDPQRRAQVTPFTESMIALWEANPATPADEVRAFAGRAEASEAIAALFARHDVLLCPTFDDVAPPVTAGYAPPIPTAQWAAATAWVNMFGLPAASVPCGFVNGLPVALQVIGPPGGDRTVIEIALAIEARWPWAGQRPPRTG